MSEQFTCEENVNFKIDQSKLNVLTYCNANVIISANSQFDLDRLNANLTKLSLTEQCFHMKHAIDVSIKDLFGTCTGASLLYYDLIQCFFIGLDIERLSMKWSILLAFPSKHTDQMITVLTLMTNQLGGSEWIDLLTESLTDLDRESIGFQIDMIGVNHSLNNLSFF